MVLQQTKEEKIVDNSSGSAFRTKEQEPFFIPIKKILGEFLPTKTIESVSTVNLNVQGINGATTTIEGVKTKGNTKMKINNQGAGATIPASAFAGGGIEF